jgi:hypothetical protein
MEGIMRTFTIPEIRAHFIGVPYSQYSPIFIALLVRNKILVKMTKDRYAYDLNMLSSDVIVLIVQECKEKQLGYTRKYNGTNRTNPKVQDKKD